MGSGWSLCAAPLGVSVPGGGSSVWWDFPLPQIVADMGPLDPDMVLCVIFFLPFQNPE